VEKMLAEFLAPVLSAFGDLSPSPHVDITHRNDDDARASLHQAFTRQDMGEWLFWYITTGHVEASRRRVWMQQNMTTSTQRRVDYELLRSMRAARDNAYVGATASSYYGNTVRLFELPLQQQRCNSNDAPITTNADGCCFHEPDVFWQQYMSIRNEIKEPPCESLTTCDGGNDESRSSCTTSSSSSCSANAVPAATATGASPPSMEERMNNKQKKKKQRRQRKKTRESENECIICFASVAVLFVPECACITKEVLCADCFHQKRCPLPSVHTRHNVSEMARPACN